MTKPAFIAGFVYLVVFVLNIGEGMSFWAVLC